MRQRSLLVTLGSLAGAGALWGCLAAFFASSALATTTASPFAIGGARVLSAAESPWAVHVEMSLNGSTAEAACSGSIIDANRVLTAGHCTYKEVLPWSEYEVRAGITNLSPDDQAQEQGRKVTRVRRHPYYVANTSVRDVAILEVSPPFDFSTPFVQPVPIAAPDVSPSAGESLRFFGWGQTAPDEYSPEMHSLTQTKLRGWQCPRPWQGRPSFSCQRSATGSACKSDSGAGLVAGSAPILVATVAAAEGNCVPGAINGGPDLTSPEISRWLRGDETPPRAPQARTIPGLAGSIRAKGTARCVAAQWSGSAQLTTAFVDPTTGQTLQEGTSPRFRPTPSQVGNQIACVSIATNAGGRSEILSSNQARVAPALPVRRATQLVKVVNRARRGERWLIVLHVRAPLRSAHARVTWSTADCRSCRLRKRITLRRKVTLTSPRIISHRRSLLELRLPRVETSRAIYRSGALRLRFPPPR
ncbi:MAG TPA: trypsin-like serine protease [Solirubrobacterales bacterium]|nr:trypsin-like serine protease [Solirubrobacterales bacterium]